MIFVDAGAFIARYLARDQHHAAAERAWEVALDGSEKLFTSSLVLSETFSFIARRADPRFAAEVVRAVLGSTSLTILRPTLGDELRAADILEKFADQGAGFVDSVSFVLMRARRITRAFTFDRRHFLKTAGFDLWP